MPLNILAISLISVVALVTPWAIGGNWPFTRTALLLATLMAILLAELRRRQIGSLKFPLLWGLLLLGVAMAAVQAFLPTSVYPAASREKLVDLILGVSWFYACTILLSDRKTLTPVLGTLALSGVAISCLGIIQKLSWNGKILWEYERLQGGRAFGTFVNKNNGAGFLLIAFGAAVFFVAYQIYSSRKTGNQFQENLDWEETTAEKKSLFRSLLGLIADLQPKHLYCGAALVIIFVGIFSTLSRGGMAGLLVASLVATLVIGRSHRFWAIGFVLFLLVSGSAIAIYSEQINPITAQVETLADLDEASAARLQHWSDAWPYAMEHLGLGSGIGTYRYVSPSFQSMKIESNFAHAENIFLETLVEMGIGGLLAVLLAISICLWSCRHLIKRHGRYDRAIGVAGLTVLLSQATASFFDFGLYQPANLVLMAIMMGAVTGRAAVADETIVSDLNNSPNWSWCNSLIFLMLLVALVGSTWATRESWGVESRKRAARTLSLIAHKADPNQRFSSNKSFHEIQQQLERAVGIRPDDAQAHFLLGQYYVARFRTESARRIAEQFSQAVASGEIPPEQVPAETITPKLVWPATSLSLLHREIHLAARKQMRSDRLSDPDVKEYLPKAWEEFLKTESLCPLMVTTPVRLAQLSPIFAEDQERSLLDSALSRATPSSQMLFDCGLLALNFGDHERAIDLWSQCLNSRLSRRFEPAILHFSQAEISMRDLFERILPQDPSNLLRITSKYFPDEEFLLPKNLLLDHTISVINGASLANADRQYFLAEAYRMKGDFGLAAEHYRLALESAPEKTVWRFEYAKCLQQINDFDEAIRQIKICELEPSKIHSRLGPLLIRVRRDRARMGH